MQSRFDLVRSKLGEWEVDAVLVTTPANRRWLTGFTGSAGQLLLTPDKAILATDSRYWVQVGREAPDVELFSTRYQPDDMANFLTLGGAKRIGIEARTMSVSEFRALQELDDYDWVPLNNPIEFLREVKSADELATIQAAAQITDLAAEQVPTLVQVGMSEAELAWLLEKTMREAGATAMAFDIIVASGPNSALPHHHPGERRLQAGDALIVDMGAAVDGYKSDLTRSFFLGESAPDAYWEIYNTVLAAHTATLEQLHAGMTGKDGDALARDVIVNAGYGDNFGHGLGHGVGLDIHEGRGYRSEGRKCFRSDRRHRRAGDLILWISPAFVLRIWLWLARIM
ncbi:MAG: Xaa-Pro peptidase family protein [Chloroflexota bacterium]